jgi:ABC-2 type transport system ATP-binding protein
MAVACDLRVCESFGPDAIYDHWQKEGILMITVRNLKKNFHSFEALKGIDLNVKNGEIYGFIGHNGAGKSTTMNILTGLSRPNGGTCMVNGKDVVKATHPSDLDIGYLPEDPRFYPWLTARETLEYLGSSGKSPVTKDRVQEMLHWVGLTDAANRRVGGFSRGMKQRLGIASAMIHNPALLILDEPSSALDPEGRSDVLRLMKDLKLMGKTVFFSTHILSDVERVCDTVGIIASGKMIVEKPLHDIQRDHILPIYDIEPSFTLNGETVKRLQALHGVTDVRVKDELITVTARDADALSKQLMGFFAAENVPVKSLTLHKHTLEDIFLKEVNGHDA